MTFFIPLCLILFYLVSRFTPPENFNLALLTLEVDFLSRAKARDEEVLSTFDQKIYLVHDIYLDLCNQLVFNLFTWEK